jgi:hypothetical protein
MGQFKILESVAGYTLAVRLPDGSRPELLASTLHKFLSDEARVKEVV